MSADITAYLAKITSEHSDQPDFMAVVSLFVQPFADLSNLLFDLKLLFDIDTAVGDQLDKVGDRIGRTRFLDTPLTGVYFAFNTYGVGFNQGVWYEPFNPTTGLVRLPDDHYRVLLKATILANIWDGTVPGAYAAWDILFPTSSGLVFLIQDNTDMSMSVLLRGEGLADPVVKALFTTGALDIRPDGVAIKRYVASVPAAPFFAFNLDNDNFAGFNVGCWGVRS